MKMEINIIIIIKKKTLANFFQALKSNLACIQNVHVCKMILQGDSLDLTSY